MRKLFRAAALPMLIIRGGCLSGSYVNCFVPPRCPRSLFVVAAWAACKPLRQPPRITPCLALQARETLS